MGAEFKPAPKRQSVAEALERQRELAEALGAHIDRWVFVADHQVIASEDTAEQIFNRFDEEIDEISEAGASSLRIFKVLKPDVNLVPSVFKLA